ncbi:hypothetical protein C5E07_05115 [Pseudoclavibacter sp. RFBJ3]|nr:hypothetical protein C5C12_05820 [Pseudoclavibacter sp. RFBJ5]PPF93889.1 hypothetical protein C5E07_05115 [Pseudoclavibacter sp. RFBJ3]PPF98607.1 hypothetical protein C5C19_08100 [Pseudoclavibacter sp. RFBH5]PPG24433.1 hypothetical protein C5E13_06770 [Pseudoclavibacter sp. RFBI4]
MLTAGVTLTVAPRTAMIDASILRFDRYLVVRGVSAPIDLTWKRERGSAQGRGLILLLEQGTLTVSASQRRFRVQASQVAIVPPGDDPVFLRSEQVVAGVIFSFAAMEIEPLRVRWGLSHGGVVGQSVLALLNTAVKAPPLPTPQSSNLLRSLLRASAQALVADATQVFGAAEADTIAVVKLIVETAFRLRDSLLTRSPAMSGSLAVP